MRLWPSDSKGPRCDRLKTNDLSGHFLNNLNRQLLPIDNKDVIRYRLISRDLRAITGQVRKNKPGLAIAVGLLSSLLLLYRFEENSRPSISANG